MKVRRAPMRPRVLYLSFYFPPSRASGVYRARATANHLAAKGWDVTACAAPLDFLYGVIGSVDEELTATIDPRITVERPSLNQFAWNKDLRQYGRFRGSMPLLAQKLYSLSQRKGFPENYASWGLNAVARGLKLHARNRFDVVLATGNPFASFGAAWLFSRITGVPYIVDYRDSWTLDLFTDSPAFPDGHPAWQWEKRVLGGAATSVFVNEALRGWHAERYPRVADRMMVVPNGWDADLLTSSPGDRPTDRTRPLSFDYLGTMTSKQPVEELTEAWTRARRHPDLADAELNIHGHLGFFRNAHHDLRQRLGLPPEEGDDPAGYEGKDLGIRYRGPVSKTEVARVYEESDVLVFLAGGGRYVTSGKIFEYMATGRPIVSVHAPGIAAKDVLSGYPLWFNADSLDVDAVAHTMVQAGKAARDLTPEQRAVARRHADGFTRDGLLAPLEARMRSLVKRPLAEPGSED
ncbi:glycosyltransferase [Plantactinospora sp. S1510]|uniref:Glycosyltransferase n=1 Tax=Plantactinospora alkalitolerans TaxID=2789879 RepID=A0ABS0H5S7_9ACTN|nr:glycosyltransferase [Plantactinospora alkalitolerans]MBF9133822.1 glycosyltransferase [Plantactinospora alkalitolerans]